MEIPQGSGIEKVTLTEVLGLDTWNEERSSDQLQDFIDRRHAALDNFDITELL